MLLLIIRRKPQFYLKNIQKPCLSFGWILFTSAIYFTWWNSKFLLLRFCVEFFQTLSLMVKKYLLCTGHLPQPSAASQTMSGKPPDIPPTLSSKFESYILWSKINPCHLHFIQKKVESWSFKKNGENEEVKSMSHLTWQREWK